MPPIPIALIAGVLGAFVLAAIVILVVRAVVHRVLARLEIVNSANREAVQDRAQRLLRAFTLMAYGIAVLASISFAFARFGFAEPSFEPAVLGGWFVRHGVNLVLIVVGAIVVTRAANLAIEHLQFKIGRRHAQTDLEWQRRAATISGILINVVTISVAFVAILMLLRELSIDVVPILTGAGIAGLAIGFGAQNLVRDFISGFFLILEDQVRVGDLARINGVAGSVEQINLRTIVLRDGEGAVQVFPNGTITTLANLSKQFAFAVVDMRVSYSEDPDRVFDAMKEAGDAMSREEAWAAVVLTPLEVVGVESFGDAHMLFRARFKTLPLNQGKVASELRRRCIAAFRARGIRPYVSV